MLRDQWQQFLPNVAASGNFFRTVAFVHPAAEQMQGWLEAIEHPLTNLWQVSEVWRRPNTGGSSQAETDMVEDGKTVARDLSLVAALEKLGEFEIAQIAMGYQTSGLSAADLGGEHVAAFAKNEGCILLKGKVHPVVNGRIVSDGVLPDGAREEAKAVKVERNPAHVAGRFDLSHLFRSHAQVQDFLRLLDVQTDTNKWKEFVDLMEEIVGDQSRIQHGEFKIQLVKKAVFLLSDEIYGQREFLEKINKAQKLLKTFPFLNEAQRKMCNAFFQENLLCYEIAYAKKLFKDVKGKTGDKDRKDLERQTQKAAQLCRQFGGSEADVQRIHAEIIKGECINIEKEPIRKKLFGMSLYAQDIYFLPLSLLETIVTLRDITKILERAVEDEKIRITRVPRNTPQPKV